MNIGIDAHTIGHKHTGNETYIANLIAAINMLGTKDTYQLFLTKNGVSSNKNSYGENFKLVKVPENPWLRFGLFFPLELKRHPIDIFHVQYAAPRGINCKIVTTIHDISYIHLPQHIKTVDRLRVERLFPDTARRSSMIITGSQATKNDIVDHFDIAANKIAVIPYGVSPDFRVVSEGAAIDAALKEVGLKRGYILYVGALQPRKNIIRLLQAFDLLKKTSGISEKLVIVGKKAWLYKDTIDAVDKLKFKEDVVLVDYVDDRYLTYIYNGAKIFVYPSLYEGFGFPPLEAMACGIPVAVSEKPAMPEVVGSAGEYFDPYSVESIARSITILLENKERREELRVAGVKRAALFSWENTARATLKVYKNVFTS